jgi:hypothetical protein
MVFTSGGNLFRNDGRPQRYQTPHAETGLAAKAPVEAANLLALKAESVQPGFTLTSYCVPPAIHP